MRRSGSVLLFAAISLALHLGWVALMPVWDGARPGPEQWVEVSFAVEEAAASPGAVVTETPSPSTSTSTSTSTTSPSPAGVRAASRSRPAVSAKPAPMAAAAPVASMEVAAVQPAAAEAEAVPQKPVPAHLLSPRAAALSVDAFTRAPALRCAAPGTGGEIPGPTDCAPEDAEAAAQAALQRDLNTIAQTVPHLKAREAPDLKRRSDGSFAFDGSVFKALVRPDGQVVFADTAEQAQLRFSLTPLKVVADINDVVEKQLLGRELYSAEKAWFLEQTRELRTQLATQARRRELQEANRALERTLQGVLGDRALSTAQKHDAVFLIWQDCGEDAQQQAHRHSVEAFVRRYLPQDSEIGFGADELERFNAQRGSLQKFEPYSDSKG